MSKWWLIGVIFLALAAAYAAYAAWSFFKRRESFVVDAGPSSPTITAPIIRAEHLSLSALPPGHPPLPMGVAVGPSSPTFTAPIIRAEHQLSARHPMGVVAPIVTSGGGAGKLSAYDAKMYVMSVFNTMLHRNPTATELDKYAGGGDGATDEAAIVRRVLSDYDVLKPTDADRLRDAGTGDAPAATPALVQPPAPAPAPAQASVAPSDAYCNMCPYESVDAAPACTPTPPPPAPAPLPPPPPPPPAAPPLAPLEQCPTSSPSQVVCMDKADVLQRLDAIRAQVSHFQSLLG